MDYTFCEYEPWMKDQVITMFCEEYGNQRAQFEEYYDRFYSSYQQNKAIRLVAMSDKTVAGFVSFSYWPYYINGQLKNSYQCGNVIINKNFRKQGLYNKMLDYLDRNAANYQIDFIIGFPIKEILKLYLKGNWKNPFNLQWFVKIVNPLGFLFPVSELSLAKKFSSQKKHLNDSAPASGNVLAVDPSFYKWNSAYNNLSRHFYFEFSEGNEYVEFSLKLNKRRYMNELIIGEVNTNAKHAAFIKKAIAKLRTRLFTLPGISILSICMNEHNISNPLVAAVLSGGFRRIDKDIKFIVSNFVPENDALLLEPDRWILYRRDIDTW